MKQKKCILNTRFAFILEYFFIINWNYYNKNANIYKVILKIYISFNYVYW